MKHILIVGGGTSGFATAIDLIDKGYNGKDITIIDKGRLIAQRKCFVDANTPCKKCHICSITNGFGGSGTFSDSKINFDYEYGRIGGDLNELMNKDDRKKALNRMVEIYKMFDCDLSSRLDLLKMTQEQEDILDIIDASDNMELLDCRTVHLGSENSRIVYEKMQTYLINQGVNLQEKTELLELKQRQDNTFYIKTNKDVFTCDIVILAVGRSGNKLIGDICKNNSVVMKEGRIDYGVRVECPSEVMRPLDENFYEAKIYFHGQFGDNTRIFCTNPKGFASIESYKDENGNKLFCPNGYALANTKSNNTNFALLVSRHFNEDCPKPIESYLYPLMRATNSLGKGSVIMQSLKDIKLNRRSTDERIAELSIVPTIKCYAGDLTSVIPYRTFVDILESIKELDKICPGIDGDNTLLYGLEVKLHSNKVVIDKYGRTSMENLYCIGDCSGYSRGINGAFTLGLNCSEYIIREEKRNK